MTASILFLVTFITAAVFLEKYSLESFSLLKLMAASLILLFFSAFLCGFLFQNGYPLIVIVTLIGTVLMKKYQATVKKQLHSTKK